jgi:hypothetical protein
MNDDLQAMWEESEATDDPGFDEEGFRDWYDRWSIITGLDSDPDHPDHRYDYRAAYRENAEPLFDEADGAYHWPSRFKHDEHPNRFVEGIDTKTGRPAPARALDAIAPSEARFAPQGDLQSMWEESLPGPVAQSVEAAAEANMRAAGIPWASAESSKGIWANLKEAAEDTYDSSKRLIKGAGVLAQRTPSIVADYIPETVGRALRGGKKTVADRTWLDRWIEENRLEGERAKKITPEEEGELWFTMPFTGQKVTLGDADKAAKSIGYSLANMMATMAGGAVGGLAGAAAGTAAGGPAGAVGGALAGRIAGGTVTGTVFSGEATKDEFLDQIQKSWLAARGNPEVMTPEFEREWQEIYKAAESDADWYGFWEAFPETVGNMLTLGIASLGKKAAGKGALASIKNRIADSVGKSLAAKIGLPVGKAAAMLTEESLTETWTQYKQSQIEAELGLRERPLTLEESFLEVLPQTVINTAVMGPFAAGASKLAEMGGQAKAKRKHDEALGKYVDGLRSGMESGTIADGDVFELTMGLDWTNPALAPLKEIVGAPIVESVRANVEAGHVNAEDVAGMLGKMHKSHPAYEEIRKLAGEAGAGEAEAKGFEAATDDEIKALKEHLSEKLVAEGGAEIVVRAAAGNRQRELVQQVGSAFGRRIVFFGGEGAADRLNGLYHRTTDTIYINETAENPYLVVLGHESLHRMKDRHADLYEKLLEAAKGDDLGFWGWLKEANAGRRAAGLREIAAEDALAREEYLADFAGQQFADSKFWERINQHDADLGKRLAGLVHEILEKIRSFLRKKGAAPEYFAQVNRVQDALASVYTEFARREKQVVDKTAQPVAGAEAAAEEAGGREAPVRTDESSTAPGAPVGQAERESVAPAEGSETKPPAVPTEPAPVQKTPETKPEKKPPAAETKQQQFDRLWAGLSEEQRRRLAEIPRDDEMSIDEKVGLVQAEMATQRQQEDEKVVRQLDKIVKAASTAPKKKEEKVSTLRGRIKKMGGINFLNFKGELKELPTAVKYLSKKTGMGIDLVEQYLREEGWLAPDESLLEVIRDPENLKRNKVAGDGVVKRPEHLSDQEKKVKEEMEFEPEEPPAGNYVQLRAEDLPEGKKIVALDNSLHGWDIYRVVEKDPFGVTLKDGTTITLAPDDLIEVRQEDVEDADVAASVKQMSLFGEGRRAGRQTQLGLDFEAGGKPSTQEPQTPEPKPAEAAPKETAAPAAPGSWFVLGQIVAQEYANQDKTGKTTILKPDAGIVKKAAEALGISVADANRAIAVYNSENPREEAKRFAGVPVPQIGARSKKPPSHSGKGKITDVGEELWYNKRNRMGAGINWDDVKGLNPALKTKEVVKVKAWPRPDYQQLVDDGMPVFSAHILKQVYDSIPNAPGKKTDEDLKFYIEEIQRVREAVFRWAKDAPSVLGLLEKLTDKARALAGAMGGRGPVSLTDLNATSKSLFDAVYPNFQRSDFREGGKYRRSVLLLGKSKFLNAIQPGMDEARKAARAIFDQGWPGAQESWQRQGIKIVERDKAAKVIEGHRYEYSPEGVATNKTAPVFYVEFNGRGGMDSFPTREEAEQFIRGLKPWILLDKRNRLVGDFSTLEEAEAGARGQVKRERGKVTDMRIAMADATRQGPQFREPGEDITPERLQYHFGFRGVNFGNWTNQAERQASLNAAYDAFSDLADILGIPPQAVSLNGLLGVAFGAQGSGPYGAHFVPGVNEINFTKTRGAGALAHEWAHALDHYFANQAGFGRKEDPYLSSYATAVKSVEGIRPEIVERFKAIMEAINKRPATAEELAAREQERNARDLKSFNSWLNVVRKGLNEGASENERDAALKEFDTLAELLRAGDAGEGYSTAGKLQLPQRVAQMRLLILDKAPKNFQAKSSDTWKAIASWASMLAYRKSKAGADKNHIPQTLPTEYSKGAEKLDVEKGGKRYWTNPTEKFARAFESYVLDRVRGAGRRSDYLSTPVPDDEKLRYPYGEERKAINAEFDALVKAVEARATDRGTGLFSIKAWHGSPYRFSRFEMQKVGTGEGSQAFGWGLYFTESKGVARQYARLGAEGKEARWSFSDSDWYDPKVSERDRNAMTTLHTDLYWNYRGGFWKNREDARRHYQEILDSINRDPKHFEEVYGKQEAKWRKEATEEALRYLDEHAEVVILPPERGSQFVYEVVLLEDRPPEEQNFVEWYEPTPELVYRAIDEALDQSFGYRIPGGPAVAVVKENIRGEGGPLEFESVYRTLAHYLGEKETSLFLLDGAGIDGIRYPAGTLTNQRMRVVRSENVWQVRDYDGTVLREFTGPNAENEANEYLAEVQPYNYVVFDESFAKIKKREDVRGYVEEVYASAKIPKFKGTREALDFGAAATPEQVTAMKELAANLHSISDQLRDRPQTKENMNLRLEVAYDIQFVEEALGAAAQVALGGTIKHPEPPRSKLIIASVKRPPRAGSRSGIPEFRNTQEALAFGREATAEQVIEMSALMEVARIRSRELMDEARAAKDWDRMDEAFQLTFEAQFLREAIEAAQGAPWLPQAEAGTKREIDKPPPDAVESAPIPPSGALVDEENTTLEPPSAFSVKWRQPELPFGERIPVKAGLPASPAKPQPSEAPAQRDPGALSASQYVRMATTGSLAASGNVVRDIDDAASLLSPIRKSAQEEVCAISVAADGTVLEIHRYSRGMRASAYMAGADIIGHALNVPGVERVYAFHNHPSGATEPSKEDDGVTRHLEALGRLGSLKVISGIIGGTKYREITSGAKDRLVEKPIRPTIRKTKLPVKERYLVRRTPPGEQLLGPQDAIGYLENKFPGASGFLFLNFQNRPVGFLSFPSRTKAARVAVEIIKSAEYLNAASMIVSLPSPADLKMKGFLADLQQAAGEYSQILDVVEAGKSAAETGSLNQFKPSQGVGTAEGTIQAAGRLQGATYEIGPDAEGRFSVRRDADRRFAAGIARWKTLKRSEAVQLDYTPDVLRMLGADDLPMEIDQATIRKVLESAGKPGGKHGRIGIQELMDLPLYLDRPIMVFDSKAHPGALVVMTEIVDADGDTVVTAIHLAKAKRHHVVNDIASVYGKDSTGFFLREIGAGRLRYIDKNKSRRWAQSAGLYLPGEAFPSATKKILLTEEDLVKFIREGRFSLKHLSPEARDYLEALRAAQVDLGKPVPSEKDLEADPFEGLPEEVKARLEAAKGVPKPGLLDQARVLGADVWHSLTRHRPYLDPAADATITDILRTHQDTPRNSVRRALQVLQAIAGGLRPKQYQAFSLTLIMRDMIRDIDSGLLAGKEALPFGFDEKTARSYLEHLERIAAADPAVAAALRKREAFDRKLKQALVAAELLPAAVLKDTAYFHHEVLKYQAIKALGGQYQGMGVGPTQDVRLRKKGWQIARTGSVQDYNTQYVEAEFEVIAQGLAQLETRDVMRQVAGRADISESLRIKAKRMNYVAVVGGEANYNRLWELREEATRIREAAEGKPDSDEKKRLKEISEEIRALDPTMPYRQNMAIGLQKLAKALGIDPEEAAFDDELINMRELAKFAKSDDETVSIPARMVFKAMAEREKFMKETLGDGYATAERIIPDGYVEWLPKPGGSWYRSYSIPDRIAAQVLAGEVVLGAENAAKIRQVLARGKPETWIIPEGLAKTLDGYDVKFDDHVLAKASRKLMDAWKKWILINPLRVVRYNLNNLSGDLDIAFAYDPRIVTHYLAGAIRGLWGDYRGKTLKPALKAEIELANRLGVLDSGWSAQEVWDVAKELSLKEHMQALSGERPNLIIRGWRGLENFTRYRENWARLAAFRYFRDQIRKGEKVYGASNPKEIDAIEDPDRRAAKLARELIGDYGNITHAGQFIRRHMIPFYAWMEINAPRYVRLMRNLKHEGRGGEARLAGVLGKNIAWKATKLGAKAAFLMTVVSIWNHTFFPDEEDELGEEGRRQLHLILGRRKDGSIVSLRFQGALSDALSWFGAEDAVEDARKLMKGTKSVSDLAKDAALATPIKILNALRPDVKVTGEVIGGRAWYPDPFNPKPIRDKLQHVAKSFSAGGLYDWAASKPKRGGTVGERLANDLLAIGFYTSDPGEIAYYDIIKKVVDWREKAGKESPAIVPTDKANALYYYKQALKFGDIGAAEKYLRKYFEMGGAEKGLGQSVERSHPLGMIAKKDRAEFLKTLGPEDAERYRLAEKWHNQTYKSKAAVQVRETAQRPAGGFGAPGADEPTGKMSIRDAVNMMK